MSRTKITVYDAFAAAIADAKREGAEQMRAAMNDKAQAQPPVAWIRYQSGGGIDGPLLDSQIDDVRRQCWTPLVAADWADRAIPLPTGPRQVVRLSDEEALSALPDCRGQSLGKTWLLSAARAIETAVLAANGLETK
jgi:hypothetical protein